jgi:hypothetical protein
MTLTEIFEGYVEVLYRLWLFDVEIMSNPWMYIPFLIPIVLYLIFFVIKWAILTTPLWLPFRIIIRSFFSKKSEDA